MAESHSPQNGAALDFATGWHLVAWSRDIKPGKVKPMQYFDKQFVCFRTESGEARLMDGFCPLS